MRQHLLRVDRPADAYASLIEAVHAAGERVGWLELSPPSIVPPELEAAAERGVLRAVAVGGGRSVAAKPLKGPPVLRDLLREHFRGCLLVLVRGELPEGAEPIPHLEPAGDGWRIMIEEGAAPRELSQLLKSRELAAVLGTPRPWAI